MPHTRTGHTRTGQARTGFPFYSLPSFVGRLFMVALFMAAFCIPRAHAAEMILNKMNVYAADRIPALHTQGHFTPFKTLQQDSTNTARAENSKQDSFVLVLADFGIAWDEPGTPGHPGNEEITYSLADIALVDAAGTRIRPVAAVTPDLRARFTANLEFQKFTARQQWWHDSLRIGAIFNAAPDIPYTLEIGNDRFKIASVNDTLPDPAALLDVTVTETTLADSAVTAEAPQGRLLPGTSVRINNPKGKLLKVALELTPQGANVEGGDIRYSFWAQDFMLNSDGAYYPLVGYIQDRHFSDPAQVNITPQGDAGLGDSPTRMTLVFAVPENFTGGSLSYMGTAKSDISLTDPPPGQ